MLTFSAFALPDCCLYDIRYFTDNPGYDPIKTYTLICHLEEEHQLGGWAVLPFLLQEPWFVTDPILNYPINILSNIKDVATVRYMTSRRPCYRATELTLSLFPNRIGMRMATNTKCKIRQTQLFRGSRRRNESNI